MFDVENKQCGLFTNEGLLFELLLLIFNIAGMGTITNISLPGTSNDGRQQASKKTANRESPCREFCDLEGNK